MSGGEADWTREPFHYDLDHLRRIHAGAADRIDRAVAYLRGVARVPACRHAVRKLTPVLTACAQHPKAGITCIDCAGKHVRGHPVCVEYECDGCSKLVEDLSATVMSVLLPGTVLYNGRDHCRAYGLLVLGGVGFCRRCRAVLEGRSVA